MAKVAFKKGSLANLPAAIAEGTFYITTDERALYLDVDGTTRVRIGDFQEFETLTALRANTNPSTTALYYVADINCLAKWDGNKYVQINPDTGATSVETTGEGNAVTDVTYDPATRKLTFICGETFATPADVDTKITQKTGAIEGTIKDYVDGKTSGVASNDALNTLSGRVDNAEKLIGELPGGVKSDNVVDYIAEAIAAIGIGDYAKAADLTAAVARIAANEGAIETLNGTGEGSVAKQVADAVAAIVADTPEAYDTLKEISDWISSHATDAAAMNSQINTNKTGIETLKALVGNLPDDAAATNVVDYIAEAIAALAIGDYATAADLTALTVRVAALEGKAHTHENAEVLDGITAAKVSAWDAAEQNAKDYAYSLAIEWGSF